MLQTATKRPVTRIEIRGEDHVYGISVLEESTEKVVEHIIGIFENVNVVSRHKATEKVKGISLTCFRAKGSRRIGKSKSTTVYGLSTDEIKDILLENID